MNPSADTFYGLERYVTTTEEMVKHMRGAIENLEDNGFVHRFAKRRSVGKNVNYDAEYPHVFLADTFFSDILHARDLFEIFRTADSHKIPCQILFLNPFSDQARARAVMLGAEEARRNKDDGRGLTPLQEAALALSEHWTEIERDPKRRAQELDAMLPVTLRRSLTGLENLAQALKAVASSARSADEPAAPPPEDAEVRKQMTALFGFLENLCAKLKAKVEIGFTSDLLLSPLYIVGPYVYRGFLMPRSSALHKPWSIYRDDPSRSGDMFELAKEAFQQAWESAVFLRSMSSILKQDSEERESSKRQTIMVAYSEDNKGALDEVVRLMQELDAGVVVERFPMALQNGDVPRDTVQRMLDKANAGIALLLCDEEVKRSKRKRDAHDTETSTYRSRPNVIHEMGLMQGRLGFKRVLLLTDRGAVTTYEKPANIDGMTEARVDIDPTTGRMNEAQLKDALSNFLRSLRSC